MTAGQPAVPIEVDEDTGVWSTDGLPMVYVPQHFLVNNHKAVEDRIGVEANAEMLFAPGYESAHTWCGHEAAVHGLGGEEVFGHYMLRLSQRGWGRFDVIDIDARRGAATVEVGHSIFVAQYGPDTGRPVCYMFAGWLCGALEWAAADLDSPVTVQAEEVACATEAGHDRCRFTVTPR